MAFAVYHGSKGKGSGGGLGNHIDRKEGKEHTYKHADPERKHLNRSFKTRFSEMSIPKAIEKRIQEGYKGNRKIRKDAVKYMSHVMTGSHEQMKKIFSHDAARERWIRKNIDFVNSEFGEENIIRFEIHLDEKTPHIHAVTVPLTPEGKLSAKEIMGNKKALTARQDRYAELMKEFGLNRGLRNTGVKHENANDYYKRIEKYRNDGLETQIKPVKGVLGVNTSDTIEKYQNALKTAKMAFEDISHKLQEEKRKTQNTSKTIDRNRKEKQKYAKAIRNLNSIILDPKKSKRKRAKMISQIQEQKEQKNRGIKRT